MQFRVLGLSVFFLIALAAQGAQALVRLTQDDSAVTILAYSRIGEDAYPDSSLRTDQFDAQLREIMTGGYHVVSLDTAINALKTGKTLPARSLAITFDGAYRSSYKNAFPKLLNAELPFTVFYAADNSDADRDQHMTTAELLSLARSKTVSLGILPAAYTHLSELKTPDIRALINRARKFHRDTFGQEARYFAYPYGEVTNAIAGTIKDYSFDASFGIHSGVAHMGSNFQYLPRFTMTESYGSLERFRLVANALPLPVSDIQPFPPVISDNTLQIGFTVEKALQGEIEQLSCFISGRSQPDMEIIENRIELRSQTAVDDNDRLRVNCTMPGPEPLGDAPRWRWFGLLLIQDRPALTDH